MPKPGPSCCGLPDPPPGAGSSLDSKTLDDRSFPRF